MQEVSFSHMWACRCALWRASHSYSAFFLYEGGELSVDRLPACRSGPTYSIVQHAVREIVCQDAIANVITFKLAPLVCEVTFGDFDDAVGVLQRITVCLRLGSSRGKRSFLSEEPVPVKLVKVCGELQRRSLSLMNSRRPFMANFLFHPRKQKHERDPFVSK